MTVATLITAVLCVFSVLLVANPADRAHALGHREGQIFAVVMTLVMLGYAIAIAYLWKELQQ